LAGFHINTIRTADEIGLNIARLDDMSIPESGDTTAGAPEGSMGLPAFGDSALDEKRLKCIYVHWFILHPKPSKTGGHDGGMADGHVSYYGFGQDISPIDLWMVYNQNRTCSAYTTDLLPLLVP
jgi:hypothetical protein